jgi:hypothetical protein
MKKLLYTISPSEGSINIFRGTRPEVVTREHASYSQIHNALLSGEHDKIDGLLLKATKVAKSVDWNDAKLKAQGAEYKEGKLFLNGREQNDRFAERLSNLAKSGLKDLS